jgi:histidine triad (HIT) family protein
MVVFQDTNPQTPVHILLIPRKHIRGVGDIDPWTSGESSSSRLRD